MKKKLTVVLGIVIIICVVSGLNLITNPTGKSGLVRIANPQRIPGPTLSLSPGAGNFCQISNDDSIPSNAYASFDSGMGIAVYTDPTKCVSYPYPFKITSVHFFLKSFTKKFASPVKFQVNLRDISGENKCNGPGSVLCSESFVTPIDSGWINLNFSQPYCVVQPFFLEVMYQSKADTPVVLPSLMMDETIQDTCDDWFLYSPDHYYSWVTFWGDPPVGDAIIRASGYFNAFECESLWYWKPAYEDYAPSGMPDFDQKQDNWIKPGPPPQWTFCGPVAVANCFWWFDSKYDVPPGLPGDGIDRFPLVRDYLDNNPPRVGFDDHDPWNVNHLNTVWGPAIGPPPATPQPFIPGPQLPNQVPSWGELVERLAWYFNTDGIQTGYGQFSGTNVMQMQQGIDMWLQSETLSVGHTLADTLYERTIKMPGFAEVESLVEKCEDVILLLGFWYENPQGSGQWFRCGGHYVTVAGVNSHYLQIAFSDPYFDNAEAGNPGIVGSGTIIPHNPGHDDTVHNDAGNISHDIYPIVQPSPSPGGIWMLPTYPVSINPAYCEFFDTANVPDEFKPMSMPWNGSSPIFTEVEYAVVISPTPPSAVEDRGEVITPKDFELYQNHPNPFNSETAIKYNLKKTSSVTLIIYNILGERVITLVKEKQSAGLKMVSWDGKDEKGNEVSSGIYFYQLKAGEITQTKRMVLLK